MRSRTRRRQDRGDETGRYRRAARHDARLVQYRHGAVRFCLHPDRRRSGRSPRTKTDDALPVAIVQPPLISTGVPFLTRWASASASQFVRWMQPCEKVLPTFSGSGTPWMPYPSPVDSSIQTRPAGLFGPGAIVIFLSALTHSYFGLTV